LLRDFTFLYCQVPASFTVEQVTHTDGNADVNKITLNSAGELQETSWAAAPTWLSNITNGVDEAGNAAQN